MLDLGFREDLETLRGRAHRAAHPAAVRHPPAGNPRARPSLPAGRSPHRSPQAARRRSRTRDRRARRHHAPGPPDRRRRPDRGSGQRAASGRRGPSHRLLHHPRRRVRDARQAGGAGFRGDRHLRRSRASGAGSRARAASSGRCAGLGGHQRGRPGIHLPDVDLIVHADLPLNADSLIHRSGRTGRAGRKGTAVVIATAGERRKAERLLATAHVTAPWTPAPSGASIQAAARARLADEIVGDASDADGEPPAASVSDGEIGEVLARLEAKLTPAQIIRGLLARELKRCQAVRRSILSSCRGNAPATIAAIGPPPRARASGLSRDAVTFRVNLGGKDNADPRWLLPLICRRGDVTRRDVGAIRIGPQETLFEIAAEAAHDFELAARERDPRALHVSIERADGSPPPSRRGPPHAQRSGSYPAKTGGYPAKTGGYPAKAGGYPAKTSGYPRRPVAIPRRPVAIRPRRAAILRRRAALPRKRLPTRRRGAPIRRRGPPAAKAGIRGNANRRSEAGSNSGRRPRSSGRVRRGARGSMKCSSSQSSETVAARSEPSTSTATASLLPSCRA